MNRAGTASSRSRPAAARIKADAVILIGLTLGALAIRLYGIGDRSLWIDEGASITFARAGWHELWGEINLHEPNPPGYYTIMKLWLAVAPISEASLRLPSAIASALCVVPLYLFAERGFGRQTAIIAATLLALSGIQVQFAQDARTYAILSLIFLSAMLAGQRLAAAYETQPDPRPTRQLVIFAVCCGLLPYLHYTGFLAIAVAFAYVAGLLLLGGRFTPATVGQLAGAGAFTLTMAALPLRWLLLQLGAGAELSSWIPRPTVWETLEIVKDTYGHVFLANPYRLDESFLLWLTGRQTLSDVLLAGVGVAGLLAAVRKRDSQALAIAAGLVVLVVIFFAVSQVKPLLMPRTILFGSGLVLVIVAYGLTALRPRWLAVGVMPLVLAFQSANLYQSLNREADEPWREAIAASRSRSGAETALIFVGSGIMVPGLTEVYWEDAKRAQLFIADPYLDRFPFILEQYPELTRLVSDASCDSLASVDRIVLINRGHGPSIAPDMNQETAKVAEWLTLQGGSLRSARRFDEIIFQEWSGVDC